ncbi:MAG: Xaa-Pro peptidase family protein [Desulfovibrionaceae bacterium]|nr:Xaa-Pro peptidase family protein [Desulfovibrionaceae bacterium]
MSYSQRRERLRALLAERSLDALLITSPSNRYYLSGFELHDVQFNESSGCLVITRSGRDFLLTDSRYTEAASKFWPEDDIVIYRRDRARVVSDTLGRCGSRIGFETASVQADFADELRSLRCLEPCNGLVEKLRVHKDAEEVAALKKSFALNHAMLEWVHSVIREGMTEAELSWQIERYFREHGASELAFPSIVAFGGNAALPHAVPSDLALAEDTGILLDVGCRLDSYCSDQTRSFWFGEHPDELFVETRMLVAEAQETVIRHMEPGAPLSEVAQRANDIFAKAGVEDRFIHGLGHGVGLDTHEAPSFSCRAQGFLEPGMTVTVEPGLYYPGRLGIRLEVTVLVEENGVTVL